MSQNFICRILLPWMQADSSSIWWSIIQKSTVKFYLQFVYQPDKICVKSVNQFVVGNSFLWTCFKTLMLKKESYGVTRVNASSWWVLMHIHMTQERDWNMLAIKWGSTNQVSTLSFNISQSSWEIVGEVKDKHTSYARWLQYQSNFKFTLNTSVENPSRDVSEVK